jgi:predicted RNase H-like nuclease (RuvC/YqgF family)
METDVTNKKNPVNENAGAKKGLSTTSIVSIIVLLAVGIIAFTLYSREHKKLLGMMEEQKVSLTDKITARDSVINEWIMTFDDIEKNIAVIKEKEKIITLNSSNTEISVDKRQQVLEDIKYINSLLEQNKKKIASLTAQLKKSGGTIKALQDKIAGLEATMKQNEAEISELKTALLDKKFEVEQLNTQMTVLNDTLARKDEKINTQTNELNKAFYAVGTFKELKEKGLIAKEGGFIGLGKTKSLTGNIPDNVFTQIDITKAKYILIDAKSAKLISEHPTGSYEIIRDENKMVKTIDIKDPAQFWKVSKYAVVEITK